MADSLYAMSDEDIMKLSALPKELAESTEAAEAAVPEEVVVPDAAALEADAAAGEPVEAVAPVVEGEPSPAAAEADGEEPKVGVKADEVPAAETPVVEPKVEAKPGEVAEVPEVKAGAEEAKPPETPPLEALASFYNQIMTPFKANGKTIELKTPEEAIQLMQMGANYTKKMQELQPHKKLLLMLQNNNLLDEGKLAFYIDVEKKNPEAIKKLIKDSGIDPLDIDINTASAYVEGGHRVSDAEVTFNTALEDLSSKPGGTELLAAIDKTWDPVSKQAAWDNPDILAIIHEQQVAGIYGQIVAEMDRQKTLGKIPATTPFIRAYKEVGDELLKANSLTGSPATTPVPTPPKVLATRIAAPKSPVTNGDKAGAAASTRAAPVVAQTQPNYLAMSDDEFMKSMEGRL